MLWFLTLFSEESLSSKRDSYSGLDMNWNYDIYYYLGKWNLKSENTSTSKVHQEMVLCGSTETHKKKKGNLDKEKAEPVESIEIGKVENFL